MKRKSVLTLVGLMLLTALAVGQMQEQYLEVYYAQVKPEKRAETMRLKPPTPQVIPNASA